MSDERTLEAANITVTTHRGVSDTSIDEALCRADRTMFNSTGYLKLLASVIDADAYYLVATHQDTPIGFLPVFVKRNDEYGNVLNSLPFFGSQGGPVVTSELQSASRETVVEQLLESMEQLATREGCVSSTIITSPFESICEDRLPGVLDPDFVQNRTAQVTKLDGAIPSKDPSAPYIPDTTPERTADASTIPEYLFERYESRCRRAIRKADKEGVTTETRDSFERLHEMHVTGMERAGGTSKPLEFFKAIPETVPKGNYKLRYARYEGDIVAGLLTFQFNGIVEYYTPAYIPGYRDTQATSLLTYENMREAVEEGCRYWNFGGTRESQESLHRFKRGWGASEFSYQYYTTVHETETGLLEASPEELSEGYEWFYAVPYSELSE